MNRFDIVGLTLAEVSLVLLFSFIAVFLPAYGHIHEQLAARTTPGDLQKQLLAANASNTRLQQELENSRPNLRSAATPTCVEVGKATGWLFAATIRGADTYQVLDQPYTLDDLLHKYAPALAEAAQAGCRQRVKVYLGQGVSAVDYDDALRRLEESFYDTKLGPEQNAVSK